jgi:2-succinyl-6-hydroxy-2,4-cyclohexadiene-1-carboxylate synthase
MPRLTINELGYNVETYGSGEPLVLLHGFMGNAGIWRRLGFGARYRVLAVDLPGHGLTDSPPDPARYEMKPCIDDLLAIFDHFQLEKVHLVGYSMGGRVALAFAATYPERVQALVLESASPGLADPAEQRARAASDAALAENLEREGLIAFVAYWADLPIFASQRLLPVSVREAIKLQRLHNDPKGLANSLRGLSTGLQPSYWEHLSQMTVPTLLIVGALDTKFVEIGQKIAAQMPHARLVIVPEAGHNVHLEQPTAFETLVMDYLANYSIASIATTGQQSNGDSV